MIFGHRAGPPDFSLRAGIDLLRGEITISRGVPFVDETGVQGGQAVGLHDGSSRTAGTAAVELGAALNRCFPLMVVGKRTFPPNSLRAAGHDVSRCEVTVLRRVPFFRQIGVCRCQTIGFDSFEIRATRTAAPQIRPVAYCGFPFMIICNATLPPHFFPASRSHVPRRQVPVFRRMPFLGKLRVLGRKRGRSDYADATAVWASISLASLMYRCLPFMVIRDRALPPDSLSAARRELIWAKLAIPSWMPFGYQLWVCGGQTIGLVNFPI